MKITSAQKSALQKLAKKFYLELVIAFGSQVQGNARADSDLDLAVLGLKSQSLEAMLEIIQALEKIFQTEIDLAQIENADPLLLQQIFDYGELLYGATNLYFYHKIRAFKLYVDTVPLRQKAEKIIRESVYNAV